MTNELGSAYTARRAKELFHLIEGLLSDLARELSRVEGLLAELLERYRKELGRTQLVLVPRRARGSPHPQNLHWAVLLPPKPDENGRDPGDRIWFRIEGELTDRHIARYAGDYRNKARYYEFDAERKALNEAHKELADARGLILKILRARFPAERPPESLATLLGEDEVKPLHPWVRGLVAPLLHLVERVACAENELRELVEDHARQPASPDVALLFYRELGRTHPRSRWRHREHGWLSAATDRELRTVYRFPKSLRRAIGSWEVPRRRLMRHSEAAKRPFDKIHELAGSALLKSGNCLARIARPNDPGPLPIDPPGPPGGEAAQAV